MRRRWSQKTTSNPNPMIPSSTKRYRKSSCGYTKGFVPMTNVSNPKISVGLRDHVYPQPCPRGNASTPRSHRSSHSTDRPVVSRLSVTWLSAPVVSLGTILSATTGTVKTMTRKRESAAQNAFLPVHMETRPKIHRAAIHVARPNPMAVRQKKDNTRSASMAVCLRPSERPNEKRT